MVLFLFVFFCSVAIPEGMDQRIPYNKRDNRIYHTFRTIATYSVIAYLIYKDIPHWYLPVLWGSAFDGLFNRILQAVRVIYVNREREIHAILTASDAQNDKPVSPWAYKHYWWWLDYGFLAVCGAAAILLR